MFDTDEDGYSRWVDRTTGEPIDDPPYPVPNGWLAHHGWVIDPGRVRELAHRSRSQLRFLCGSVENETDVRDLFDLVVCLVIDDQTLRHRLATRTTNAFGRNPDELAAALEWNPRMRPLYERLGAVVVDATLSPSAVANLVLDAARQFASPES